MESKEFNFKGLTLNGFFMVFVSIVLPLVAVWLIYECVCQYADDNSLVATIELIGGIVAGICSLLAWSGFLMLEPNTARVTTWFGKYSGTFNRTGFHWINPFYSTKKVSLRARNLDVEPIKVNDKVGNPVMIGLVLDLGTIGGRKLAAFDGHGVGHDEDHTVAALRRDHGKPDTGIAARGLDDSAAGNKAAGFLCILDDGVGNAILDRAAGVGRLVLAEDGSPSRGSEG